MKRRNLSGLATILLLVVGSTALAADRKEIETHYLYRNETRHTFEMPGVLDQPIYAGSLLRIAKEFEEQRNGNDKLKSLKYCLITNGLVYRENHAYGLFYRNWITQSYLSSEDRVQLGRSVRQVRDAFQSISDLREVARAYTTSSYILEELSPGDLENAGIKPNHDKIMEIINTVCN
jgi:hypothetical protein